MASVFTGIPIVYGVQTQRPLVNIPADALRVRVKLRANKTAVAFVRFHDRIEQWAIGYENDKRGPESNWALRLLDGVNLTELEARNEGNARCRCGRDAKTPHPCPYLEDIKGDNKTLCTCCKVCEKGCFRDT